MRVDAEFRESLRRRSPFQWRVAFERLSLLHWLGFGLAFFIAYGYAMNASELNGSPFWLPDSVLLCALLLSQPRTWPVYIAATLPLRLLFAIPPDTPTWFLFAAFANDSLKALLAAGLLRWTLGARALRFDRIHDFSVYLIATVLITPALSSLAGAASWAARGREFWPVWQNWFLGDALVNLVFTPLLLCLTADWRKLTRARPSRILEGLAIFSGLIFVVQIAYRGEPNGAGLIRPLDDALDYAPVAFLLWAAVRLGPAGASASLAIMSMLSMLGVSVGHPASSLQPDPALILSLQLFLIVIGVPIMLLSVLMEQQRATERSLRENEGRLAGLNVEQKQMLSEITALSERLFSAHEDERRRIGGELHDDLNQQVAVLGIQLSMMKRTFAAESSAQEAMAKIESGLANLGAAIHALSYELHPAFLERTGIVAALRAHCEEFKSVNGVNVHLRCEGSLNLPSDLALCLYRVAQEALRNVAKHSGAKDVWISLCSAGGQIHLSIEDSGHGFHSGAIRKNGIGLVSMKDRVRMVGGSVEFERRTGGGTVTHVVVPWPDRSMTA